MGNRAVVTTPERKVGIYLHWNGGRDTIEPLLKYCELQGYRAPSSDDYGWARMCQVMGNFFGGSTSLGIGVYTNDRQMDPGDNGIYIIENGVVYTDEDRRPRRRHRQRRARRARSRQSHE